MAIVNAQKCVCSLFHICAKWVFEEEIKACKKVIKMNVGSRFLPAVTRRRSVIYSLNKMLCKVKCKINFCMESCLVENKQKILNEIQILYEIGEINREILGLLSWCYRNKSKNMCDERLLLIINHIKFCVCISLGKRLCQDQYDQAFKALIGFKKKLLHPFSLKRVNMKEKTYLQNVGVKANTTRARVLKRYSKIRSLLLELYHLTN